MTGPARSHLLQALKSTGRELVSLGGVFLILGTILHWQERANTRLLTSAFGWKAVVLTTGWIGTPVHETSHLVAAVVFRHRIGRVAFFKPDPCRGTLGYVEHSYNPGSLYQLIGNFFIGVAPLFGGSLCMFLAYWFLARDPAAGDLNPAPFRDVLANPSFLESLKGFFALSAGLAKNLFTLQNLTRGRFWVFLYIVFCVGMHLAPSRADLEHAVPGFLAFAALVFAVNLAAAFFGGISQALLNSIKNFISPVAAIMLLAVVLNFFNLALSLLLANTLGRL